MKKLQILFVPVYYQCFVAGVVVAVARVLCRCLIVVVEVLSLIHI